MLSHNGDLFKRKCKPFQESRVYFRHYAADCMPSFNPIMVEGYAALFSCTVVFQASDPEARNSWLKLDDCLWLDPPWFNYWFSLALARSVGI